MDQSPKCKNKTFKRKYKLFVILISQWVLRYGMKNTSDQNIQKNKLCQNLKYVCFKEYYQGLSGQENLLLL